MALLGKGSYAINDKRVAVIEYYVSGREHGQMATRGYINGTNSRFKRSIKQLKTV